MADEQLQSTKSPTEVGTLNETDKWPYIPAKYQKAFSGKREILWIVIHDMEAPKSEGRARQVAHYFQNPSRAGSSHVTVDDKEIIQCVLDNNIAAGAVGANTHGLHIEQPGYAAENPAQWDDPYGKAAMENAADVAAQWCHKFGVPVHHLTNEEYGAGQKGILGHLQVTQEAQAKHQPNTGHTDPGLSFPWTYFMGRVQFYYDQKL